MSTNEESAQANVDIEEALTNFAACPAVRCEGVGEIIDKQGRVTTFECQRCDLIFTVTARSRP